MRHTLMLNLDEAHAIQLEELRQHFHLAADDTVRLAIRLTHARHKQKPDVLVPEFKPHAKRDDWYGNDENTPYDETLRSASGHPRRSIVAVIFDDARQNV